MDGYDDLPDELRDVAERLRREATRPTATELDHLKLRAMRSARSQDHGRKGSFMKSRLATLMTIGALTIGTGGTFAIAGGGGGHDDDGNASEHQYKPPCDHKKGEGDRTTTRKGDKGDDCKEKDKGDSKGESRDKSKSQSKSNSK